MVMAGDAGESLVLRNEGRRGGWDEHDGCPKSSTCVFEGVALTVSEEGSGIREALAREFMIASGEHQSVGKVQDCEAEYADEQSRSGCIVQAILWYKIMRRSNFAGLGC